MNMRAEFPFDPGSGGNPNAPVCGYCNLVEADHEGANHIFDAVGGSLSEIDWRNGPPPIGVFKPVNGWALLGKGLVIAGLASAVWGALIYALIVTGHFLHLPI